MLGILVKSQGKHFKQWAQRTNVTVDWEHKNTLTQDSHLCKAGIANTVWSTQEVEQSELHCREKAAGWLQRTTCHNNECFHVSFSIYSVRNHILTWQRVFLDAFLCITHSLLKLLNMTNMLQLFNQYNFNLIMTTANKLILQVCKCISCFSYLPYLILGLPYFTRLTKQGITMDPFFFL